MFKKHILLILFSAFAIIFCIAEYRGVGDFRIFLLASKALGNGYDIYVHTYHDGFHYFYSPFFALLIKPLTFIPMQLATSIWSLISFAMFGRSIYLLYKMFLPDYKKPTKFYLLTFATSAYLIFINFHMKQMSAFLIFAVIESVYLTFYQKKPIWAALLLALAINIKMLPLVFIPYFIYRRQYIFTLYFILFTALYIIVPGFLIGFNYNFDLLKSWWHLLNPSTNYNVLDLSERGLHSLSSLISSLFSDYFCHNENHWRRNIATLDLSIINYIINATRAAYVFLTLYFLQNRPFSKVRSKLHQY